jgi:hypothetical protein
LNHMEMPDLNSAIGTMSFLMEIVFIIQLLILTQLMVKI